jgi:hypothetical protein
LKKYLNPIINMTLQKFKEQQEALLLSSPNLFWAKRLDHSAHIPTKNPYGVECGKYGALLGNNYAGDHVQVCPECVKKVYEREVATL